MYVVTNVMERPTILEGPPTINEEIVAGIVREGLRYIEEKSDRVLPPYYHLRLHLLAFSRVLSEKYGLNEASRSFTLSRALEELYPNIRRSDSSEAMNNHQSPSDQIMGFSVHVIEYHPHSGNSEEVSGILSMDHIHPWSPFQRHNYLE